MPTRIISRAHEKAPPLCATVGLAYGIESQNIVGYQTPDVANLVSIGIDSFSPVTGESFDLQSLKITAKGIEGGQIQLQTLTTGAATDRTFFWIPEAEIEDYGMESEGWLDADTMEPGDIGFDVGAGFLLMNDFGEGATITYAGQVPAGTTEIPVAPLVSICGNATPVPAHIQAMPIVADGIEAGQIQLQTLTDGAATDQTFFWIPEAEIEDYGMESEGWLDADTMEVGDKEFAAGEGFLLMNDFGVGAKILLPSPLN